MTHANDENRNQSLASAPPGWPSVNDLAAPLVAALIRDAAGLRVGLQRAPSGCLLVDAGIAYPGGLEAGRRIAEICLGGLGSVNLSVSATAWPVRLAVHSSNPVLACLGSQYAGWRLAHGEGKQAYHALGSGPGRSLAGKEPLFAELGYHERSDSTCVVLEVDRSPPPEIMDQVA